MSPISIKTGVSWTDSIDGRAPWNVLRPERQTTWRPLLPPGPHDDCPYQYIGGARWRYARRRSDAELRTPQGEDAVGGALIYINARAVRCAMVAFRVETHLTASA
jgi:hypothetical protein